MRALVHAATLLLLGQLASGQENRDGRKLVVRRQRRPVDSNNVQCNQDTDIQLFEDPDSCNNFYKCENGSLTLETCENGLLYDHQMALTDAVHNYCVYNWKVDCGQRLRNDERISSPGCEYRFGIFPIEEGCLQSYYQCSFGLPTEVPCESENVNIPVRLMLSYDRDSHTCGWPDQLQHSGCNPTQMFGFSCPALEELVGTPNEQFSPFPRFPVEGFESIYLICVDGQPRLQSCGSLDIWNEDTLQCTRKRSFFG